MLQSLGGLFAESGMNYLCSRAAVVNQWSVRSVRLVTAALEDVKGTLALDTGVWEGWEVAAVSVVPTERQQDCGHELRRL